MRPATILHTSDVHLGSGSAGAEGREERAFVRAIDLAVEADVDAMLITGDLFDHARVPGELLEWAGEQLDRADRPVVLLVGNHDALHDRSVHHRFLSPERCEQVLFLDDPDGSMVEIPGTDVVVWGRAMVEHEPAFRPLAGVPERPEDRWTVIAAHGLVLPDDRPSYRSSPITPAEIDAIDWDYVALGHIHAHQVLRDAPRPALYPGSTASSRAGEAGVVLVDFAEGEGANYRWVGLDT